MFRFILSYSIIAIFLALGFLVSGCGDDAPSEEESTRQAPTTSTPATSAVSVDIQDFKYKPSIVTVKAGGKVTWVNRDAAKHNSQTDADAKRNFNTGDITQGKKQTVTFTTPGSFEYYCIYHRFMNGTVKVVE